MTKLALIRHGQSAWNLENRFTGWWDADLTAQGEAEARASGKLLAETGATVQAHVTTPSSKSPGWQALAVYQPLLLILAYILGASVLVQIGLHGLQGVDAMETMRYFMAGFFLVFSFFKLLNINAFAKAYAQYDLLAARWLG